MFCSLFSGIQCADDINEHINDKINNGHLYIIQTHIDPMIKSYINHYKKVKNSENDLTVEKVSLLISDAQHSYDEYNNLCKLYNADIKRADLGFIGFLRNWTVTNWNKQDMEEKKSILEDVLHALESDIKKGMSIYTYLKIEALDTKRSLDTQTPISESLHSN